MNTRLRMHQKVKSVFLMCLLLLPSFLGVVGSVIKVNAVSELGFSTYFGGNSNEKISDIVFDNAGNIYVSGTTSSTDLGAQNVYSGGVDAFIAKFTPAWQLVYVRYLGGRDSESVSKMSVDVNGNIYLTGTTRSFDFPTNINTGANCPQAYHSSAFAAKFNSNGSLVYSTCIAGGGELVGNGVDLAVDSSGNAIYSGSIYVYGTSFNSVNAYLVKLSENGDNVYRRGVAGSKDDYGYGTAIDNEGNAYLTGVTSSNDIGVVNAQQSVLKGTSDAFILKVSPTGTIVYLTYLGGDGGMYGGVDGGNGVAINEFGHLFITGRTTTSNFPTTLNAYDRSWNAYGEDIFLTEFSSDGQTILYSTFIGGSSSDIGEKIFIDDEGNIYLTGNTSSISNFPIVNAYESIRLGIPEFFVMKLSGSGTSILFSTYLGDIGVNLIGSESYGFTLHEGKIYITGSTSAYDFPVINAYQNMLHGPSDGFVAELNLSSHPPVANAGADLTINEGQQIVFDGSESSDPDGQSDIVDYRWNFGDGTTGNGITIEHKYLDNGVYTVTLVVTDTQGISDTDEIMAVVNNVVPSVGPISPVESVLPGVLISTYANFTDPGILDTHTATINWGDGIINDGILNDTNVSGSHIYSIPGNYLITLTVTDNDGGFGINTTNVTILSSVQAINNLVDLVETYNLQQGILNNLDAKLDAAINALDDVNQNNDMAAINTLEAFINAVESQRDNKITSLQADQLIQKAREVIAYLSI